MGNVIEFPVKARAAANDGNQWLAANTEPEPERMERVQAIEPVPEYEDYFAKELKKTNNLMTLLAALVGLDLFL